MQGLAFLYIIGVEGIAIEPAAVRIGFVPPPAGKPESGPIA
jgi:hypothetical protein